MQEVLFRSQMCSLISIRDVTNLFVQNESPLRSDTKASTSYSFAEMLNKTDEWYNDLVEYLLSAKALNEGEMHQKTKHALSTLKRSL